MTKALIAARSGSERVKNKNIRPFAGRSLLEYKIKQLLRLKALDGVVVNSNDDEILLIALHMGCETIKREQVYADAATQMSDVYVNMAENFPEDIVVYCNVTNPLINDTTITSAIELFCQNHGEILSVNTAHVIKEFLYLNGNPINYDPRRQPRSQDLPDIFALNFAVNVIARDDMIKYKNIIAPRYVLLPIQEYEAVDIDTMLDFKIAEILFERRKDALGYVANSSQ